MKSLLVDTSVTILFFTAVASFSELVIAGMALETVLLTRLIMMPVMILTGRPYGVYRDWWMMRVPNGSTSVKTMVDIVAFLSFQVPVYVATLLFAGARWSEIVTAVSSALILMVLVSRPFGLVLDFARRKAGVAV
nr:L-alanine exporter AlaE [uncultured Cohaesibacter sp.]